MTAPRAPRFWSGGVRTLSRRKEARKCYLCNTNYFVLHSITLHQIVLCIKKYYVVVQSIILCYTVQLGTAQYYFVLHNITLYISSSAREDLAHGRYHGPGQLKGFFLICFLIRALI